MKVGDVVKLKSGGPNMTVAQIGSGYPSGYVGCIWFEKRPGSDEWGACNTQQFHIDSLTIVESTT